MKAYCKKVRNEYEKEYYQLGLEEGEKRGRMEVVKWASRYEKKPCSEPNTRSPSCYEPWRISIPLVNWEAKLKEWGIE